VLANQIDVSYDNVRSVLEQSFQTLVIMDFWADWCEPCKQLMPVLEKIAAEYPQHVMLAKVNCDSEGQLAAQFGVRSLPTVLFLQKGQPVDGFAGLQSETEIRQRLAAYLPSQETLLLQQLEPLLAAEQWADAVPLLQQVLALAPSRADVTNYLALAFASLGRVDDAQALLDTVGMADQDAIYRSALAKVELARQAADSPEIRALEQQVAAAPDDLQLQQQLAVQYQAAQRSADALALLFAILKRDMQAGECKKLFLDILAALPKGDTLAGEYRRKLYSLLY
jgi:putative thioredoxin